MNAETLLKKIRGDPAAISIVVVIVWLMIESLAFHVALWPRLVPWLRYADQSHYLDAAFAWRDWDLTPARHNYPPAYPLLGVPFIGLMPWQPFAIPDALCLAISAWLFQLVTKRLFPGSRGWPIAAPVIFAVACTRLKILREIWFVPWTTTLAMPLQLCVILFALRYREAPRVGSAAAWGVCLGLLAGTRPVDAAILMVATGVYVLFTHHAKMQHALRGAAMAACGFAAAAVPLAVLHFAAHGFAPGKYMQGSAAIGFEWRLLPLRWVLLVIDPRPLTDGEAGMMARIPWFVPGLAGLLYACVTHAPARSAWRLLTAALLSHLAVYLCYRDLEPGGLWRFHNVHYFKWLFPFLLLASGLIALALWRNATRRRAVLCLGAVAPLFLLRAEMQPLLRAPIENGADRARLPLGFPTIWDNALLPITGSWSALYLGRTTLTSGTRTYTNVADFKLFPKEDGALLLPLRPLPQAGLRLIPGNGTNIKAGVPAVYGVTRIVFGLPYFLAR